VQSTAQDGREERKAIVKRLALITVILGTAIVLVPVASAMPVSDDGPVTGKAIVPSTQPTNPATQALMLRSEELAKYYGMSPATQAVLLRSTGLAGYYGSGGATATPITTGGSSFDWNTAIGATLTGFLLLALAGAAVTRRRHRLSF
jgi:hypothetical protein